MKGIILAGGSGTRLYPLTKSVSKQLMPLYDKPMIYYSLSTLMLAKIKDVLIISTPHDIENFKDLLGDGTQFGMNFTYQVQDHPNGLAEAFLIGEKHIGADPVAMILGDNFFFGECLISQLKSARKQIEKFGGASIFGTYVKNPCAYGVVEFDKKMNVISIEEKPTTPKSEYAIPGLYFFDNSVVEIAKSVSPSKRGELEITSIIETYLNQNQLKVEILGRGMSWLDAGTHADLLEAANFVKAIQERQGLLVGSPEEISLYNNWVTKEQLKENIKDLQKTEYGKYLTKVMLEN